MLNRFEFLTFNFYTKIKELKISIHFLIGFKPLDLHTC